MKTLLTICARKGSQGLPGKHLKSFCGKPLIVWSIYQATASRIGDVVVSTDSLEIMEYALSYGCDYIARPPELCQNDTPKLDAIRHTLETMEKWKDKKYDCVIDLDACNPLRTIPDLFACHKIFKEKMPNTLVSAVQSWRNPYFNQVEVFGREVKTVKPAQYIRRQDTPRVYDLNCCIYIYDRAWLLNEKNKSPLTTNTIIYEMQPWQAIDIDDQLSFDIAEFVMKQKKKTESK